MPDQLVVNQGTRLVPTRALEDGLHALLDLIGEQPESLVEPSDHTPMTAPLK